MTYAPLTPREYRRFRRRQFWNDHGIFRELFYANFHEIAPGIFRSAQPSPEQLRRWHARHGFRTVLNIRAPAPHESHFRLEQEICDQLGIRHVLLPGFGSRDLPDRSSLLTALDLLPSLERPVLLHCKSGADRAGIISALCLHALFRIPVREAAGQLRLWPFGHIRQANTGILDWFFRSFEQAEARAPGLTLRQWVESGYDREALLRSFHPWYSLDWITDRLLRRE